MDRETVRILLLVLGVFVIAGVYIWGRYKQKLLDFFYRRGEYDELAYEEEELPVRTDEEWRPEQEPVRFEEGPAERLILPADGKEDDVRDVPPSRPKTQQGGRTSALGAPFLIQLSVVAAGDEYFDGEALRDAMVDLDLIYGDMNIYHRYDREYREPLFSVASLVEPGTFPIDDMENFRCPGVVLFFQPAQVSDPLAVFEDLVNTCHELAERLDGIEWDERRQPLTEEKIASMRQRLEETF